MKKIFVILLAMTMIFVFAACGNEPAEPDTPATDVEETESYTVGMLTRANLTEEEAVELGIEFGKNYNVAFFDDLNAMVLALESGDINAIVRMPESTAGYIVAKNDAFAYALSDPDVLRELMPEIADFEETPDGVAVDGEAPEGAPEDAPEGTPDGAPKDAPDGGTAPETNVQRESSRMAVMEENAALAEELDAAINAMQEDGTLEQLIADYLTAYIEGTDEPAAIEMPVIEGADTLKFAITGCLPPMDFISAAGEPAGFNVAFLAEIGKRLNKNIELVVVDAGSRAMALASGKVDVIFWTQNPDMHEDNDKVLANGTKTSQIDVPQGVVLTQSYFIDNLAMIYKK